MMKPNINSTDKWIRILIAALLIVLYFTKQISGTWGIVSLIVAVVLLATAFMNFCPIWHILGISTLKKKDEK